MKAAEGELGWGLGVCSREQIGVGLGSAPGSATSSLGDSEQIRPLVRASVPSSVKWGRLPRPPRCLRQQYLRWASGSAWARGRAYRTALPLSVVRIGAAGLRGEQKPDTSPPAHVPGEEAEAEEWWVVLALCPRQGLFRILGLTRGPQLRGCHLLLKTRR